MTVIIDPRRHDAVLFAAAADVTDVARRLQHAGVRTAALPPDPAPTALQAAAERVTARPGRCVVVTDSESGAATARSGGFALVIGIDRSRSGSADVVLEDLTEMLVRTGDHPMSSLPDALAALASGELYPTRHPAVFFDFDGTLSEIVNDPDTAQLVDGAAEALRALSSRCPVAVLSGRDLVDVQRRIGLADIWYAGSHGFELTAPDGTHHQNDTAAAAVPVLAEAAASLHADFAGIPGVLVENKRFAVAVHYRNAARDQVGAVAAAVRDAGKRCGLRVTTGREVIELRPDIDWDKGKTLRWVLDRLAGDDPLLPIYLGDDITDEDAFDALTDPGMAGIGIVVRHTEDGDRASAARFALDSPAQVVDFVTQLARHIG